MRRTNSTDPSFVDVPFDYASVVPPDPPPYATEDDNPPPAYTETEVVTLPSIPSSNPLSPEPEPPDTMASESIS